MRAGWYVWGFAGATMRACTVAPFHEHPVWPLQLGRRVLAKCVLGLRKTGDEGASRRTVATVSRKQHGAVRSMLGQDVPRRG